MNEFETMGGAMAVRQGSTMERFRQGLWVLMAATAAGICLLFAATVAKAAPYGIETASVELSTNQAGAHPDLELDFKLTEDETISQPEFGTRMVVTDLPPGLVGNVSNFSTCGMADVIRMGNSGSPQNYKACPRTSIVGYMDVTSGYAGTPGGSTLRQRIYRLPSDPGEPAAFGTAIINQPVRMTVGVRTDGDYGIQVTAYKLPEPKIVSAVSTVFWGVPADHQGGGETAPMFDGNLDTSTKPVNVEQYFGNPLVGMPRTPLLTNPTSCTGQELTLGLGIASWADAPGTLHSAGLNSPAISGCEKVDFKPTISVKPDSSRAGQPSGLAVDVKVPQTNDATKLATSTLKDAKVTLPKGVSLSTALAEGLEGCTDAQFGLHSKAPDNCPPASKIGTVQIDTPLLEAPMTGAIYSGSQESNDPTSGRMYRIFTTAEGEGVLIKLEGQIKVDPDTGQITTTFADNPQLPFNDFSLKFKGGDRAPLVLPGACGEYRTVAQFTGYSAPNAPVETWGSFEVDQGCGTQGFAPGFSAGTTNPIGGSYSPFTLRVTRPDGQPNVSTIQATLPEGVLAKLAGVPLCNDADAATGNCPSGSQVGTATVGTGAGASPLYVPQPGKAPTAVYLAGPYEGAPYSLVAKVPAQAGPFDLGTVTVRNTINVDPTTAQVSVKSDPLPQILEGIPIAYRDIRVDVDRSDFTLNPTSCDPMQVKGTIGSSAGTSASVADRFQVASCEALRFEPKLKLSVKGATHRNAHPAFKAVLRMPQGANIEKAQVTLPKTELLENAHIRTICTRVQYNAGAGGGSQCPPASIYGKARAWSPLLDEPLEGPVYLRSSDHQLPDLVASLDGQIHIDLVGRIDAVNARIRNTFEGVPDAPVSRFVLEMQGGKKGLLANNTELCKTTPRAAVRFDAHSGKLADSNPVMKAQCGKARKGAKKRSAHRQGRG